MLTESHPLVSFRGNLFEYPVIYANFHRPVRGAMYFGSSPPGLGLLFSVGSDTVTKFRNINRLRRQ